MSSSKRRITSWSGSEQHRREEGGDALLPSTPLPYVHHSKTMRFTVPVGVRIWYSETGRMKTVDAQLSFKKHDGYNNGWFYFKLVDSDTREYIKVRFRDVREWGAPLKSKY